MMEDERQHGGPGPGPRGLAWPGDEQTMKKKPPKRKPPTRRPSTRPMSPRQIIEMTTDLVSKLAEETRGLAGPDRDRHVIEQFKEAFATPHREIVRDHVRDDTGNGGGDVWADALGTIAYGCYLAGMDTTEDRQQEQVVMWAQGALARRDEARSGGS